REASPSPSASDFQVGDRLVRPTLNRIEGPSGPVQVERKVMEVLVHLAGRGGEVVSKEELVQSVWDGRFVSDDVVWRSIRELRRALGDGAIETIPKRGYRLVESSPPARDPHPLTPSPTRTHTRPGEGGPPALDSEPLGGGAPLPGGGSACGRGDGGEGPGEAGSPELRDAPVGQVGAGPLIPRRFLGVSLVL